MFDSSFFLGAARDVGIIACFRALPFLGFAILTGTIAFSRRLAAGAALAAIVAFCSITRALPVLELCLAYFYFAVVGSSARAIVRYLRAGRITPPALFVVSTSCFLLLPAVLLRELGRFEVLILGWDFVLKFYSYCLEKAKSREEPVLSECLFFLLVNPLLVYSHRGTAVRMASPKLAGALRVAAGLMTLLAGMVLLRAAYTLATAGALAVVAFAVLRFLAEYARHSGLASLQIGLMRQLDQVVPERYTWPILATSPLEFWRRWNTYVGAWVLRYVFSPFALTFARGAGRARLRLAQAGGVAAAFAVVGLLHDAYAYSTSFRLAPRSLLMFCASGGLVLVWLSAAELAPRLRVLTLPAAAIAGRVVGALAFWVTTLALFSWWIG
jgi:hypothetical protein